MATLVHVYSPSVITVPRPPGLGDFLRGTLALMEICKGHSLWVDFRDHPIQRYLENDVFNLINGESIVLENRIEQKKIFEFFTDHESLKHFIDKIKPSDSTIYFLITNAFPKQQNQKNACLLGKKFSPTLKLQKKISDIKQKLPGDFQMFHLRLLDKAIQPRFIMKEVTRILQREKEKLKTIIISNSLEIKIIARSLGYLTLPGNPIHTGDLDNFTEKKETQNHDAMESTLIEFFLLQHAKVIKQFSAYGWGSGFSQYAAEMSGTPLFTIQKSLRYRMEKKWHKYFGN